MLYSETTGGFYDPEINSDIPIDVVEISQQEYELLLIGQTQGLVISPGPDGVPVLREPEPLLDLDVQSVTMRQARLALHAVGKLAAVDAAIEAMPEPARTEARIEWNFAGCVEKSSPLIQSLAPQIGINQKDLTELFNGAARL